VLYQKENNMKKIELLYSSGSVDLEIINGVEKRLKLTFPKKYVEHICRNGHSGLIRDTFDFKNVYEANYIWTYKIKNGVDIRDFSFHSYEAALFYNTEMEAFQDFDVYGYEYVIGFGCSANGDHICFDYRHDPNTDEPKVVLMFHDAYDDVTNKMLICPVADSFEAFMDSLYEYKDEE
jgi:cell wall assembly regulator SMI1